MAEAARSLGISRWSLDRRFAPLWLIDIPCTPDPHCVHDQIFIDATYTALLKQLAPPLCVVLDGGQGAYSAITTSWPTTKIQRCLVHAQRAIRRYTTSRPRTDTGTSIYTLALKLTTITIPEQATTWTARLHEYGQLYHNFLNEKTILPKERNPSGNAWEYTHIRVCKAYNSLMYLQRKKWLFPFLEPPEKRTTAQEMESHDQQPGRRV